MGDRLSRISLQAVLRLAGTTPTDMSAGVYRALLATKDEPKSAVMTVDDVANNTPRGMFAWPDIAIATLPE